MSSPSFELLDPQIQRAIWDLNWSELRPLQADAIRALLTTDQHLLLSAATASGKTEAAFLPILSAIVREPMLSIQAMYVSPLKALINDQFRRLEELCAHAEIPVHRWHGDVDAEKKRQLRRRPGGVLLITPESLESNFINYGSHVARIYKDLRFVVVDEVHSFLDDVRGVHLQSLLSRLRAEAKVHPRMLGLSATLADFLPAKKFLDLDEPRRVTVIRDDSTREIRVSLKSFIDDKAIPESASNPVAEAPSLIDEIAEDLARSFRTDANLIFTNSRRFAETLADGLQQIVSRERWARNPFYVHHGSLSREIREDVEFRLKSGEPISALCTSTLEMGIDIGAVRSVGQIGPTWSVNSLVQRLGRSGRKEGQPAILRFYAIDDAPVSDVTITDQLYPDLIQSIAMVELMLKEWLEPIDECQWHLSTCIHQVLSVLRQTGGARADRMYDQLCKQGPFRKIDSRHFRALLLGLAKHDVIEQIPTGELILAPNGERTVESREFYAAFMGGTDFRVIHNTEEIGNLPSQVVPPVGQNLILNGRRWQVDSIEQAQCIVNVLPSKGAAPPAFLGSGGDLHPRVVQKMRDVLASENDYAYLHPSARETLERARAMFRRVKLESSDLVRNGRRIEWFPWLCSTGMTTVAIAASKERLKADAGRLSIVFDCDFVEFERFIQNLAANRYEPRDLAQELPTKEKDRFDHWVSEDLLNEANADSRIYVESVHAAALRLFPDDVNV